MSPLQHAVIASLWAAVVASETVLLLVLLWRKAWRGNAAFTSFIAFCVLRSCLLLYANFVLKSSTEYFLIRWGAYLPQSVLLIMVVLEVIQIIFRPYEALPRGTLGNFVLAICTIVTITAVFTVTFSGGHKSEWITFLQAMDQGVSWTILGIFAIIAGFAAVLGVPWNHRVYGIVVGFTFYLSVDVAVVTMIARIHFYFRNYLWPVDMFAFLVACSGWTYYFAHDEVPRAVPKMDEVHKIAALLSRYVFVIESLEVPSCPKPMVLEEPTSPLMQSEER